MRNTISSAINRIAFFILVPCSTLFLINCTDDAEPGPTLPIFQEMVIDYFQDVALGYENGGASEITRRWGGPMYIFIGGDKENAFLRENVEEVVAIINQLATNGFQIEIVQDSSFSNAYIFFGSPDAFGRLFPEVADKLSGNFGWFNVWWNADRLNRSRIFVNTVNASPAQQRSLIFEEIVQSLGLGKDSPKYPDSIFYEIPGNGGFAQQLSDLDRELIRLLYHPRMRIGLNATQVEALLREILTDELENV